MPQLMYHMADAEALKAALADSGYAGSPDDIRDGFIHFSTAETLAASAAKHRAGQEGLVLVACDPAQLGDAVKWEEARGSQLFPHLYRALQSQDILWTADLPLGPDGLHQFPDLKSGQA